MFHCLPDSAWADGNLAEVAGQLGKMLEHRNQSQPNPGLSSLGTPCTNMPFFVRDMPLRKPFLLSTLFGSIVPSSAMRAFSLISFLFSKRPFKRPRAVEPEENFPNPVLMSRGREGGG